MKLNKEKFDEMFDEAMKTHGGRLDEACVMSLMKQMLKRGMEKALQAELTHHLGYEKHAVEGRGTGNSRNGTSTKTMKGDLGEVVVEVPRDRTGEFEPQLISRHQTRLAGLDEKILSMYARGMTTRDIQGHLQEMYGVDVSAALVSEVTDAVLDEVKTWQNRPLEQLYAIVYLDALVVKVRHNGRVDNRAFFYCDRDRLAREERRVGDLGDGDGGGQVLAGRGDRAEESRREGCADFLCRRPQRIS